MLASKRKCLNYLKAQDLMTIATYGLRPTACALYYGVDDNFNFYIITPPSTEHGKNILNNHTVACTIFDSHQTQFGKEPKIGVQVYGEAQQINLPQEMKEALDIWSKKRKNIFQLYFENISRNIWELRPFIIRPTEIKWFNEELYGEEGFEIFKFI